MSFKIFRKLSYWKKDVIPILKKPYIRQSYRTLVCRTASFHVVDLRSDTVTKPSPAMLQAMTTCDVGDDVHGDDPTVNELQTHVASMFGKERALFVPSGTMGNLISVMSHCPERGLEAIVGHLSHIVMHEQGGIAQIAGINPLQVINNADGTMNIEDIREKIRIDDPHFPKTRLICVENTQNQCGGKVIPTTFLKEVYELAQSNELKVHLDGARVLNATAALGIPVDQITQHCDSISMCFSKGLGAPVGSIIAGNDEFIYRAVRARKVLGGGMRQAGVLAACARVSLEETAPNLHKDHQKARSIAHGIVNNCEDQISVDIEGIHTNIVFLNFKNKLTAPLFVQRLSEITDEEVAELGDEVSVKVGLYSKRLARFVTHCNITEDDVVRTNRKIQYVLQEFVTADR